jgi:hypothetical protein
MFLALWEYEVKPESEKTYRSVYGPEGDWARLFRQDARYHGTRLLQDAARSGVYMTLDLWESFEAYEEFLKDHKVEYEALERVGEGLTISEQCLGWFRSLPEIRQSQEL